MSYVHHRSSFSFILVPLVVVFILFGIFSIVWMRSSVRTMEYSISALEEKRSKVLKEKKLLLAERAGILSVQRVKNSWDKNASLVFPDRTRVVYVKKGGSSLYKVSFEGGRVSEH